MKLLIIGYAQSGQMGNYLASAAEGLAIDYRIMDMGKAEAGTRIAQSFYWRFRDRRPAKLTHFAEQVLAACMEMKPDVLLTTGIRVPLKQSHLEKIRKLGTVVTNYSTDDPWNPVLRSKWFSLALPSYDIVFTPRRANLDEFIQCGVRAIHYIPFAYDPQIHKRWPESMPAGAPSDVLFVGGCDGERLPLISALVEAGLNLALFGRYWDHHSVTRPYWRGVADQDIIRAASTTAEICLCLVRRANRDSHVMRSFEAAAIGGCILAEDTVDHRDLFGPTAYYFNTIPEMVQQAKILKADADLRRRLSLALSERMAGRRDTYADRLAEMLRLSTANELTSRAAQ